MFRTQFLIILFLIWAAPSNAAATDGVLSGHSFRVGAALDLLEQGEPLERIMLRGGWQTDSTTMKYLRNWCIYN